MVDRKECGSYSSICVTRLMGWLYGHMLETRIEEEYKKLKNEKLGIFLLIHRPGEVLRYSPFKYAKVLKYLPIIISNTFSITKSLQEGCYRSTLFKIHIQKVLYRCR